MQKVSNSYDYRSKIDISGVFSDSGIPLFPPRWLVKMSAFCTPLRKSFDTMPKHSLPGFPVLDVIDS
jgi:hypothetical protein